MLVCTISINTINTPHHTTTRHDMTRHDTTQSILPTLPLESCTILGICIMRSGSSAAVQQCSPGDLSDRGWLFICLRLFTVEARSSLASSCACVKQKNLGTNGINTNNNKKILYSRNIDILNILTRRHAD